MRSFICCMVEIDLDPIIHEALGKMPFIRAECYEWFADLITEDPNYPRGMREKGTRITPQQRVELGLEKWGDHLNWEIWNALTDEAKANAAQNFDALCNRISANAHAAADQKSGNEFLEKADFFTSARFEKDVVDPCQAAIDFDRTIKTRVSQTPLKGCDRKVCGCRWRLLPRNE
jgi:hypothetical protein